MRFKSFSDDCKESLLTNFRRVGLFKLLGRERCNNTLLLVELLEMDLMRERDTGRADSSATGVRFVVCWTTGGAASVDGCSAALALALGTIGRRNRWSSFEISVVTVDWNGCRNVVSILLLPPRVATARLEDDDENHSNARSASGRQMRLSAVPREESGGCQSNIRFVSSSSAPISSLDGAASSGCWSITMGSAWIDI